MESSQLDLNDFCRLCLAEVDDDNSYNIFTERLLNKIILATSLDVGFVVKLSKPQEILKWCRLFDFKLNLLECRTDMK